MLDIVILAAGLGSRMHSKLPKVLHKIAGKPMVQHVLDATAGLTSTEKNYWIVVGHGSDEVRAAIKQDVNFVSQTQQLGTGHAVQQVAPNLEDHTTTLIVYGDVPLLQTETLEKLVDNVGSNTLSLLTVNMDNPTGYGRIIRNKNGAVTAITEEKDATDIERSIEEVNTGIMAVKTAHLKKWLAEITNENAQAEYYLTDIIALAARDSVSIKVTQPRDCEEVLGVNNRIQQAVCERYVQKVKAEKYMSQGLTLADPLRFDCRGELTLGLDVAIDINVVLEGSVVLEDNVSIAANCYLKDCTIGQGSVIKANSMIESSTVAEHCEIGPFARLRPGAVLEDSAKVGNFVEIKKSVVGHGSKVNHLSYIGDTTLGKGVNIGAGTITCNYDGVNKFKTTIGDNSFVGSNSALVAPLTIAAGTTIAAGSTITRDTDKDTLAVARNRQKNISDWVRPKK